MRSSSSRECRVRAFAPTRAHHQRSCRVVFSRSRKPWTVPPSSFRRTSSASAFLARDNRDMTVPTAIESVSEISAVRHLFQVAKEQNLTGVQGQLLDRTLYHLPIRALNQHRLRCFPLYWHFRTVFFRFQRHRHGGFQSRTRSQEGIAQNPVHPRPEVRSKLKRRKASHSLGVRLLD